MNMRITKGYEPKYKLDIHGEKPIFLMKDELEDLMFVVSTFLMDLENTKGESDETLF